MRLLSIIAIIILAAGGLPAPVQSAGPDEPIIDYGLADAASGWLLTSNQLHLTRDGGASWQTVTPAREPGEALLAADFVADGHGWAALGRPAGDEQLALRLARSADWGTTWSYTGLPLFDAGDPEPTIGLLHLDFTSPQAGSLRVRHVSSSNFERWSEWTTADGGETWERARGPEAAAGGDRADGERFGGPAAGWRLERTGSCQGEGATRTCKQITALLVTADGGQTWREAPLPQGAERERTWTQGGSASISAGAAAAGSRTLQVTGQGFDKCEVASGDQLWDWRLNSPYSAVNLYIGGAMRACRNSALSADYLRYIASLGWTFIPTWVGPQSPCYGGSKGKMSLDPATAQGQGWGEAMAAADTATWLGLTAEDGTGSIVYYDMEYYNTSDAACNAAVQSFVTGWTQGLHARGNLAGVYGTGSTLRLLASLAPPPDAIWAAHWIRDEYDPYVSVWNVYALSDTLWVNQQRLRQYTGGHWETWGSSSMNIDANVLEGVVAVMHAVTPTDTPTPTPTPTATPTRIPFTPTAWHYLPLVLH